MVEVLTNKPLKEVIFELHWELPEITESGEKFDPSYRRFFARMEAGIIGDYPEYKPLSAAEIPERLIPHIVQHQFWTAKQTWPVIQVGSGIITVNDAAGYHWADFKEHISYLVESFFKAYPDSSNLNLSKVSLKYINARVFDYDQENVFEFLKDKLKVGIDMSQTIPKESQMTTTPYALALVTVFTNKQPKGSTEIKIRRGKIHEDDVLFLELTSVATAEDTPVPEHNDIVTWSDEAHSLIRGLFFKMIEGELFEEFK